MKLTIVYCRSRCHKSQRRILKPWYEKVRVAEGVCELTRVLQCIVSIVNAFTQCSKTMTPTFTKQPSHLAWANIWKQTQTNTLALKYSPKCRFRCQWRYRSVLRFTVTMLLLLPLPPPATLPSRSYNTKCRQLRVLNVNITNFAAKLIPPPPNHSSSPRHYNFWRASN